MNDIVCSRVKTTGIIDIYFKNNEKEFKVIDVGGMRNERKKWLHVMNDVDIIIFTVPLNEFYLLCYEDSITNRLQESINLFNEVFHSEKFKNMKKILLFTKVDLFINKIKEGTFINKYFDGFTGDNYNPMHVFEFILDLFKKKYLHFNYHVVNLTDSEEVNNCLDCIFTDNGRFLSKLLTTSGKDFKLKLFNELNENHQLISDLDIIITSSQCQ